MAGRLPVSTEPVLIAPLARLAATQIASRNPDHTFVVEIPRHTPPVEADPDLLDQVLRNLYENAVKYAPHGGIIRTTANISNGSITIEITDEGIGISAEHVDSVFERFRRLGADPRIRGMGLGLYLSRHLVEAQGGQIGATSPGPGLGATFMVNLPAAHGWDGADATDGVPTEDAE
jgi:signal transduction histidine kinase